LAVTKTRVIWATLALLSLGAAPPAWANSAHRTEVAQALEPPGTVPDEQGNDGNGDSAGLLLRVERLETDLRRANGQIEELQNQNQRIAEELRKFREDVESRFSSGGKTPLATAAPVAPQPAAQPLRKSDAFDPNASPNAAGSPQQLGTTSPSAALTEGFQGKTPPRAAGQPLDLAGKISEAPMPNAPPLPSGPLKGPDSGPTIVNSGLDFADGPRNQFNAAVESYKAGQYSDAEAQLKAFLAANGGNRLAPDAVFFLGETYLQRSRPREAAEQYLKLSTDFSKSQRAPEGMMRLGQSLAMLGNTEQACATLAEVPKRYPAASSLVKRSVERELQKDHC
jgi:tol-pal system protein YbgF